MKFNFKKILFIGITAVVFFIGACNANANPILYTYSFSYQYESVCPSGTTWNGSICEAVITPTGTISASSCTIPIDSNACTDYVTWETYNPIDTSAINSSVHGNVLNGNSGDNVPRTKYYGVETLYLYNNGQLLAQTTSSAYCEGGSTWNGSYCQSDIPPDFTLTAVPDTKRLSSNQAAFTISATPLEGFNSTVALSYTPQSPSLPAGTTYTFSPTSISCNGSSCTSSTFTIVVPAGTTTSTYTITINGNSNGLLRTKNVSIVKGKVLQYGEI